MTDHSAAGNSETEDERLDEITRQVLEEQESDTRATGDEGPRDDDQADELADEAAGETDG